MSASLRVRYLEKERILEILKQMLSKESSITYAVKSSRTSLSIYFRLYSKDTQVYVSRRISDHITSRNIQTLLVGPTTKYKHVENFIKGAIKQLGRRRRAVLWKFVKEQVKNGNRGNEEDTDQETRDESTDFDSNDSTAII